MAGVEIKHNYGPIFILDRQSKHVRLDLSRPALRKLEPGKIVSPASEVRSATIHEPIEELADYLYPKMHEFFPGIFRDDVPEVDQDFDPELAVMLMEEEMDFVSAVLAVRDVRLTEKKFAIDAASKIDRLRLHAFIALEISEFWPEDIDLIKLFGKEIKPHLQEFQETN